MLRHDVDHSLDFALELAWREHELGIRATYFLLPGSTYWGAEGFSEKVRQLSDFGHEVGLHFNGIAQWFDGRPIAEGIREDLATLRGAGVDVSGISVHGDRRCYEHGFINYWCFAELRAHDVGARETGRSAEGVPTPDQRRSIEYPSEHRLVREDGAALELWSMSLADFGLTYEATHIPVDQYFSDSGGTWLDGRDPAQADLSEGRTQILMHPEYYRDEQRRFWFLGPARSGTKWLARLLDQATSLTVTHEMTLNNTFRNGSFVADHATGSGFTAASTDVEFMRRRVVDQLSWIDSEVDGDYGECNVYLPFVLDDVEDLLTDDVRIGLLRDPWAIVMSLLERDWYDVADDPRHPPMAVAGWDDMNQVERIAWYVRLTQDLVRSTCAHTLDMDALFSSTETLERLLRRLGIAFYPRLVGELHAEVVDPTRDRAFVAPAQWDEQMRARVGSILDGSQPVPAISGRPDNLRRAPTRVHEGDGAASRFHDALTPDRWSVKGAEVNTEWETRAISGVMINGSSRSHGHVVVGGSSWQTNTAQQGFKAVPITQVRITCTAEVTGAVWLFALMYGEDGTQTRARRLIPLSPGSTTVGFRVRPNASTFDIALYFPASDPPATAAISELSVETTYSEPFRSPKLEQR